MGTSSSDQRDADGGILFPGSSRTVGLAAQAFALLGTFVGIFTIAIGVGPQTKLDMPFHVVLVAGLLTGLAVVARQDTEARSRA